MRQSVLKVFFYVFPFLLTVSCKTIKYMPPSSTKSWGGETYAGGRIFSDVSKTPGTLGMEVKVLGFEKPFFITCASSLGPERSYNNRTYVRDEIDQRVGIAVIAPLFFREDDDFDIAILRERNEATVEFGNFKDDGLFPLGVSIPSKFGSIDAGDIGTKVYFRPASGQGKVNVGVIDQINVYTSPINGGPTVSAENHFAIRSESGAPFLAEGDCGAVVFNDRGAVIGMIRAFDSESSEGQKSAIVTKMSSIATNFAIEPFFQ